MCAVMTFVCLNTKHLLQAERDPHMAGRWLGCPWQGGLRPPARDPAPSADTSPRCFAPSPARSGGLADFSLVPAQRLNTSGALSATNATLYPYNSAAPTPLRKPAPHSLRTRRFARALFTKLTCAFPPIEPIPVAPLRCDVDCRARQRGASGIHSEIKSGSIYMFIQHFLNWHGFCCGEPAMDLHGDR